MVAVLKDVKYLAVVQQDTIPESAVAVFGRREDFWKFTTNLNLTVKGYNQVRQTMLEVEYPLIEGELKAIDEQLEYAEKNFTWNSEGLANLFHHVM